MQPADENEPRGSSRLLVSASDVAPTGAADINLLATVANDAIGRDPELDTSETGIAIEAVAKAVGARIRHSLYSDDEKSLAVFLVTDRARDYAERHGATREPIVDNGGQQLNGHLWIAAPAFKSAYRKELSGASHAEIFEEIYNAGLGAEPLLVFDPNASEPELRYYPNGVSDADTVKTFLIASTTFTLEALDKLLTRFHDVSLRTPDAVLGREGPWDDPANFIPRKDTEAFLQNWLKISLSSFFQEPFDVYYEVRGTEGRCDLMLVSRHPSTPNAWVHNAVLELKVLRSKTSGGSAVSEPNRKEAIEKGLLQAIAYRNQFSANVGMLCCFDMRSDAHCNGDACLDPIREQAATASIQLRNYRLYPSSNSVREQKYG